MYQTKSNKTVTVISVTEHPTHPVMVVDIKGKTHMYTKDGCYIEKGFPHKMDIVEI